MVAWAHERAGQTALTPRYGLDLSRAAAPPVVADLVAEHLQASVPGADLGPRWASIVQVILARVGEKTWRSYASHFAAFVRFCVEEGLEFLPASQATGLLWAQYLASKGTVQARSVQPYFSAVNTVHDLLGFPKPCTSENPLFAAYRKGWERLQVSLLPGRALVLAFPAEAAWRLYQCLPTVSSGSVFFVPLLFVVLSFCTFLRPDSLLSVQWARVAQVGESWVLQYKPLSWKGRVIPAAAAPVLQFPLCGLPYLRVALWQQLKGNDGPLWASRQSTPGAERWFRDVLRHFGLRHLEGVHTLYSLRRGGASAARAAGVPLEVIESFGGWAAGSTALRQHYLDMGVMCCPAARAFFGPLAAGRAAPFVGQFFNR